MPLTNIRAGLVQGNFWVQRRIGLGNIGETFVVKGTTGDDKSFMKVLSRAVTSDKAAADRFLAEITRWTAVNHPGIVRVETAGNLLNHLCILTRYVDGEFLNHRIAKEGRMDQDDVVEIAISVAVILQMVYDSFGFIHGDVRPTNIMRDKKRRTYLFDPGNHKYLLSAGSLAHLNHRSDVAQYMSPQSSNDPSALTPAADIYGLGASMFYLLSGRPPIMGSDPDRIMSEKTTKPPMNVSEFVSDVKPGLAALVERMMAPRPTDRPKDWKELKQLLERGNFENAPKPQPRRRTATNVNGQTDVEEPENEVAPDGRVKLSFGVIGVLLLVFVLGTGIVVSMIKPTRGTRTTMVERRMSDAKMADVLERFRTEAVGDESRIPYLTNQLVKLIEETDDPKQKQALQALIREIARNPNAGRRVPRERRAVVQRPKRKQPEPFEHWTFNGNVVDGAVGRIKGIRLKSKGGTPENIRGVFYAGVSLSKLVSLVAHNDVPDAGRPFTWACWFSSRNKGTVLGYGVTPWGDGSARVDVQNNGIYFYADPGLCIRVRCKPLDGKWKHLAATYDGQAVALYLNGRSVGRKRCKLGTPASKREFRIGGGGFAGRIDEAMIFDTCLTPGQVKHVALGAPMYPVVVESYGIVARWPVPPGQEAKFPKCTPLAGSRILPEKGARRFHAADGIDCLAIERSEAMDVLQLNEFTISAWYMPDKEAEGKRRDFQCIVSKNAKVKTSTGSTRDCPLFLRFLPSGCFQAEMWVDGEALAVQSVGRAPAGQWHHVAMRLGSGKLKIYVNGHAEGERLLPSGAGPQPEYEKNTWYIGAHMGSKGPVSPANGLIDEVLFFNRPLTDQEIRALNYAR